jgi:hypothetical protein
LSANILYFSSSSEIRSAWFIFCIDLDWLIPVHMATQIYTMVSII